ncbi:unnamed protein product, partial [Pylaiella littoralis]
GGAYQPQFPGRYHNDGGNETGVGDEDRNNRRQLHGGGGAGFTAKVPRDSSSSGSSDQRSNSRRIIHVGLGEENKSTTQMGYDKAKRVELSSGKHGQTSRSIQSPPPSVRRQLASPKVSLLASDDAPARVQQRENISPARVRRLQAEGSQ